MDPKMEIQQPTEGSMEVMDDEASTSPPPETVTIDSEGEMEEEIVEEPIITTSRIVGPRNATRTTQTKKREPDVIDLTEDDEEMKSDEIIGASAAEAEDQEMPQLIDIQPIPRLQVAEDQKKRGNDYFKVGNYYQALDMYSKAIASLPMEDASYYGNRSACYMMLKRYKEALGDIRKSLQLDPSYSKGYLRLVRTTLALGNVKECEMAFESAGKKGLQVGAESERERLQWLKQQMVEVEATKVKKDYRKLVFLTTKGLEVATADTGLKMIKADALVRLGRHSEAQEICTEVLQNDIRCPEALYIRAMCHYLDDNVDKSIQFVRQGLQFAPDNPSFQQLFKKLKNVKELRESGSKMFVAHRYQEAKKEYHTCLALVSGEDMNNMTIQSKLHFNLALIAQKLSNVDESLEACTKAIELNSSYLKAFIHRARVYVLKEMYDEAVRDFEAALKLDPSLKDLRTEVHRAKLEAKRAKRKDYYKILQVDKKATEDEIRKAYKKRALMHHPDRHANAPEAVQKEQERLFKDLGEAYEVLSDSKKRFRYDQGVDLMEDRGYDGGFDASSDFLNVFFSNSAGGMPGFRAGPTAGARGHHQFHHTFRH